jgi:hypothetical protein
MNCPVRLACLISEVFPGVRVHVLVSRLLGVLCHTKAHL